MISSSKFSVIRLTNLAQSLLSTEFPQISVDICQLLKVIGHEIVQCHSSFGAHEYQPKYTIECFRLKGI